MAYRLSNYVLSRALGPAAYQKLMDDIKLAVERLREDMKMRAFHSTIPSSATAENSPAQSKSAEQLAILMQRYNQGQTVNEPKQQTMDTKSVNQDVAEVGDDWYKDAPGYTPEADAQLQKLFDKADGFKKA